MLHQGFSCSKSSLHQNNCWPCWCLCQRKWDCPSLFGASDTIGVGWSPRSTDAAGPGRGWHEAWGDRGRMGSSMTPQAAEEDAFLPVCIWSWILSLWLIYTSGGGKHPLECQNEGGSSQTSLLGLFTSSCWTHHFKTHGTITSKQKPLGDKSLSF